MLEELAVNSALLAALVLLGALFAAALPDDDSDGSGGTYA
jgi:hypothetical protein